MAVPRLKTERLLLREWRDADREPFAAMNADPRVMEHFPKPLTPEESDDFVDRTIERWATDGFGLWAVERQFAGCFIGFTGLAAPTFEAHFTPCVEVGWRFAVDAWARAAPRKPLGPPSASASRRSISRRSSRSRCRPTPGHGRSWIVSG